MISYSNVCKPLHWKAFIHAAVVDGATLHRRDIVNAHQSVRRGPDLAPRYSMGVPGIDMVDEEGLPADLMWMNYLNDMPPVGAAFADDLKSHLMLFRMRQIITDDRLPFHRARAGRADPLSAAWLDTAVVRHGSSNE